jgi:hypothetical protein
MIRARPLARPLAALALSLAWPAFASADSQDEAASTELFNAGRDLMRRGDYAAACPKLADSARLKPTVGALAKLAECEEHEKRLVSAYTRWMQALNLARSIGDDRAAEVEREVSRLDRVVPKVHLVASSPLPPETVIRVDDLALSTAGLGVPLPVELGRHVVAESAPHAKPWSTTIEVTEPGGTTSVTLPALEPVEEPRAAGRDGAALGTGSPRPGDSRAVGSPFTELASPGAPRKSALWRTVGLATAAAGVGALAAGGVFGVDALRRRDDAHCAGTVCPDRASAATLQSAKTSADWSTGLLIAGGVLAAGGIGVWILARDAQGVVRVGVTACLGGMALAGRW